MCTGSGPRAASRTRERRLTQFEPWMTTIVELEAGQVLGVVDPSQLVMGRRDRAVDQAWAHRTLLLCGGDTLSCRAALRLEEVVAAEYPLGTLPKPTGRSSNNSACCCAQALWTRHGSKTVMEQLLKAAAWPETNRLYCSVSEASSGAAASTITPATIDRLFS